MKWIYLIFASASILLGIIGLLLPIIPSVPFFIFAAFLMSKHFPAIHHRLMFHLRGKFMSKSSAKTNNSTSQTQDLLHDTKIGHTTLLGLSEKEARTRLENFGPNEIQEEKSRSTWLLWVDQFKSPLVILLILASILSGFLEEWVEAIAITAILILNALIGFFQEFQPETAIKALKNMTHRTSGKKKLCLFQKHVVHECRNNICPLVLFEWIEKL